ncbi:MAG: DUF262 domain-containing protein [Cyclobacteriaceae bacterium]|nr:DUF262 domain-containing protein [Cyclobacteriaceae bacterium]
MDKRVYYGEYSLRHWIDLILKENIVLPWYQRSFVWDKGQIENLIKTLDNNQFIPPIIIGAVKKNNEWKNYILDGQQRLTSILFAEINKYIDTKEYISQKPNTEIEQVADDITDNEDDVVDEKLKMIRWNFREIIKDKKINSQELESSFYKKLLDNEKDKNWFNEHFLGFAYIKPNNDVNEDAQSKFYSDIFRNINIGGTKLTRLENRKSLYFLKEDLKNFFVPEFLDSTKVETSSKESGLIDFIKYLSILSQYKGNNSTLLKYGGRDWEKNENYYHEYITAVVDDNPNNKLKFDVSYPTIPYSNERIEKLKNVISQLEIPKSFASIIEMDMYFFGLVNEIIFLDNQLDETRKEDLKNQLNTKINELRNEENHKDNPHALKYLKSRISASLNVYKNIRTPQNA